MALQVRWNSNRSKQVRRQADLNPKQGCGDDVHMLVGVTGSGTSRLIYRSLVQFAIDAHWTNIKRIVKAEIVVKTETSSTHFSVVAKPRVHVSLLTANFADGSNAENVWTTGDYEWPGAYAGINWDIPPNPVTGGPWDENWVFIDVTSIIKTIVPKTILMPDGSAGAGGVPHGWVFDVPDNKTTAYNAIFHAFDASGSTNDPYLLITYDPVNNPPVAPIQSGPTGNSTWADAFSGTHSDPDGDPMKGRAIEVYPAAGGAYLWRLSTVQQPASPAETASGVFSVPLSLGAGVLKLQADYAWAAQTQDSKGAWGPLSGRTPFRITASAAPSIAIADVGAVAAMEGVTFGGSYTDPAGNALTKVEIQAKGTTAHSDAAWTDESVLLWNTGESNALADEVTSGRIARPWAGQSLPIAGYTYRVRAQNNYGLWSAWVYDDFSLTAAYSQDPGAADLTTQLQRNAPIRIALYGVGTLRAPGALIGYIDDPIDLGASRFLNGAGELYFSLPALHPYCQVIEPHQTHYQVQQWYGDRYRTLFAGLITDFDAVADDMIAYGTDYLGLLATAVDERYNAANDRQPYPVGSFYPNVTIDTVIRDQLTYQKGLADSPVGFVTLGTLSVLAERVTINSSYSECLPFLLGLMNSHKAGTGRAARLYEFPTNATWTSWEWRLTDAWGKDRPNIQLEYGGLLNDFRVVAFGDFGTRVLGVGQRRGEVKVYSAVGKSYLNESVWGRTAKTAFFPDINDQNDLQRRVNEQAAQLAKVGKRIALAIQADVLSPFDGWDVGDNIILNIVRGVVDTSRYGTNTPPYPGGYWTVQGVEWNYHPDGHSDLTLTVTPKDTLQAPNPDLIPSQDPGVPLLWQVGYGVPSSYASPPSPTPPPAGLFSASEAMGLDFGNAPSAFAAYPLSTDPVQSAHYQDLNTGCIYELDLTTNVYNEVYCPASAPGGGYTPDTTPPSVPLIKATASTTTGQLDGTSITNIVATVGYASPPPGLTDLDQILLQTTRQPLPGIQPPQPDWSLAAQWLTASADRTGTLDTNAIQPTALQATSYWLRAAAIDVSGNRSGWSAVVQMTTAQDVTGPPQPSGIVIEAGMSTIGLTWAPIEVNDLDYVEVQYGVHPATTWTSVQVHGTIVVLTGLANETTYDVRLRSVDTSGNVLYDTGTTDTDGNPIFASGQADALPDSGWVSAGTATPTTLPGSALVWNSAIIGQVFAGQINADWISAGTLRVGGATGNAAAITVYDAANNLIGRWSTAGIEVMDPTHTGYKLVITNAGLTITDGIAATPVVTMSPLGIDAASITFGSARGGHNLIQNSSFEMGKFGVTNVANQTWDVAADWNAAGSRQGADANVTTGASTLTMTTI